MDKVSRWMMCAGVCALMLFTVAWNPFRNTSNTTADKKAPVMVSYHNEVAHYLAGTPVAGGPLDKLAVSSEYRRYSEAVDKLWGGYKSRNLDRIRSWSSSHLSGERVDTVLYPFSGPDILNALALFPQADSYILFGMENPGVFTDPRSLKGAEAIQGLWRLRDSLGQILNHNFFHTNIMKQNVGTDAYNMVNSIMQFFIVRSGYDVNRIRSVTVSEEGAVVDAHEGITAQKGGDQLKSPRAIEIWFSRPGENRIKKLLYVQVNLSDATFSKYSGLVKLLQSKRDYITILKAASYLLHRRQFDDIRRFLLSHSRMIVQDSSGIPYLYLKNGDWDVSLYGVYRGSIPLFRARSQPELEHDILSAREKGLNFQYGYTSARSHVAHLIVARKKQGVRFTAPVYDQNMDKGEETLLRGNKSVRIVY